MEYTPSLENAEKFAKQLYETALAIGRTINLLDQLIRHDWQAINDEEENCDIVYADGEKVMKALKEIALRLDRGVVSRIQTT